MRRIVMFSLEGRIGRREHSVGVAAYLVLMLTMHMIVPTTQAAGWYAFAGLFILASAVLFGMSVRRAHDFGRQGSTALWTVLPLFESAAVVSLYSGAEFLGLETRRPYVIFAVTCVLAVWGTVGTAWLMRTRGDEGENAYGVPPGSDLPQVLVAGQATVGLVGAKTVRYGDEERDSRRIAWGRRRDRSKDA